MNDSTHVFHVAKTGNDGNAGNAQQYPIDLTADAKLTIASAVSAASNGDKVVIWPGDYDETVDLDTANKSLILEGVHRDLCRIARTGVDQRGIILEDNSQLYNLSVSTTHKSSLSVGVYSNNKNNLRFRNCDIFGAYDGLQLGGFGSSSFIQAFNCRFKGNYDGINMIAVDDYCFENCVIEADGTFGINAESRAMISGVGAGHGIWKDCTFRAYRDDNSTKETAAVYSRTLQEIFTDCLFMASAGNNDSGNVYGVWSEGTTNKVNIRGGVVTVSTTGSGNDFSLYNTAGVMNIADCIYDTSKIFGTILQGGSGTTFDIITTLLANTTIMPGGVYTFSKILKIITAFAAGKWQDKSGSPGTYEILDPDDGVTVVMEITPGTTTPQKTVTVS